MGDIDDYEFPDDPYESPEMEEINQIQLPNGSIYGFEDMEARDAVSDITSDVDDLEERVMTINRSLANFASASEHAALQNTLANNYYTKNPQNLPSRFNSTDRASMNHLKNGWYWHFDGDGALNLPSDWGFMIKFGFENDGDFSALYFTQMTGAIYRCSGNANGISGWVAI